MNRQDQIARAQLLRRAVLIEDRHGLRLHRLAKHRQSEHEPFLFVRDPDAAQIDARDVTQAAREDLIPAALEWAAETAASAGRSAGACSLHAVLTPSAVVGIRDGVTIV